MRAFSAEETVLQYNVLGYRVDAYLPKHKLGIEVDEQDDRSIDRFIDYDTERQKAITKFIRIDRNKEGFDINIEFGRVQNRITLLNRLINQLKTF